MSKTDRKYVIRVWAWFDGEDAGQGFPEHDSYGEFIVYADSMSDAEYEASELLDNEHGVHDYYEFRCVRRPRPITEEG